MIITGLVGFLFSVANLNGGRKLSFNPDAKEFVPRQARNENHGPVSRMTAPFESHIAAEMGNTSSPQDPSIGHTPGRSYAQAASIGIPLHNEIMGTIDDNIMPIMR